MCVIVLAKRQAFEVAAGGSIFNGPSVRFIKSVALGEGLIPIVSVENNMVPSCQMSMAREVLEILTLLYQVSS